VRPYNGANVVAVLQEMGDEGVAQGVGAYGLGKANGASRVADRPLEGSQVYVVSANRAGAGIHREAWGGEDPLPGPVAFGVGGLAGQGIGEVNSAVSLSPVLLMKAVDILQVGL